MAPEQRDRLLIGMIVGGSAVFILTVAAFWVSLLLDKGPAFIPNYEDRMTMFRSLRRRPRNGGTWTPRQGDNWIF